MLGCTWKQTEQVGAVVGRLCSNKRMRGPLVPARWYDGLVWIILQAGWEAKAVGLSRWRAAGPAHRETSWVGSLYTVGRIYLVRAGELKPSEPSGSKIPRQHMKVYALHYIVGQFRYFSSVKHLHYIYWCKNMLKK